MASQQSWAAWLLDSYASSVSPVTSDSPYRYHNGGDSISIPAGESTYISSPSSYAASPLSDQSEMSSVSNSSAYGPYVKTGRGGAGNFTWQSTASDLKLGKPHSTPDLEAQAQLPVQSSLAGRRKAAAKLEAIDTQEAVRMRQHSAHYLGTGRGGAGNYMSPSDKAPPQRSPSLPIHMFPTSKSPTYSEPVYRGRGGAGNYAAATTANTEKETEKEAKEKIEAEQRRELIVSEVEGILQPPPGAWLGGRSKSEVFGEDHA